MSTRLCFVAPLAVSIILGAALLSRAAGADPTSVAPEPFFRYSDYGGLALSPSGRYIAALVPLQGRVRLAVIDLDTRASKIVASMDEGNVRWFAWVNDKRLVLRGATDDESLDRRRATTLAAVNADGTEVQKFRQWSFYSALPGNTDEIYIYSYELGRTSPNLARFDTKTGRSTLSTLDKPGDVVRWVVDRKGAIRAAVTDEKTLATRVFWRADEQSPWVQIGEYRLGEGSRILPVSFDGDGTLIVASNIGRDTYALYRYDVANKALGEELVAHPQVDLTGGLVFDRAKNRIVGVRYDGPRPGAAWFDDDWARLQKTIDTALPDHANWFTRAGGRALVYSYSDTDPGSYYLYDDEKRKLEFLGASRKAIKPETMPARTPVRYLARDGLEIPGYLTLPKGKDAKNLPLIVDVHGGPFVRGAHWAWSPEPAYLASLGYAVLEPEFRGSAGWGSKLQRAGWKQWGRAMQDDLNDGVDWLAREGTVDPKRVCIVGASYGGYAVMMGLARDPKRWRCGINMVGVTDINLYFDISWADYAYSDWIKYAAKEMIGDQEKDAAMLKAASPLERAKDIEAPVLMVYGLQDRRVPIVHGEKMRDALMALGKSVDWIVYQEEGHGFELERNRFDLYRRVAAFLANHNPPD